MALKMAGNYWNSLAAPGAIGIGQMGESARIIDERARQSAQDAVLMERFRSGDRDAFNSIYRAHSQRVFRFAMLMTGDSQKASEATQDVFVWLVHHPDVFDPARGELSNLLVGVARNQLRKRHTEEQRWIPLEDTPGRLLARGAEAADLDDDGDRLHAAIGALPESYRAVVVLCDLEEKTYEEAAMILEVPMGTVRSRLHRARALLARKLGTRRASA
jgi:RNA polymerase sigma-70 factor (ECF subfamily)